MPVLLLRLVTALLLVSVSTLSIPAQQTKPSPDDKPRKVKREVKKAYVDWIDNVDPILTQAERDAWKKLETDEEREQFIEDFWRSRDPDPDTEENEFKLEYFERVAYANEHFSSGKPGRLTDRGRITSSSASLTISSRIPPAVCTSAPRMKAAARLRLTRSRNGSIVTFRMLRAVWRSSLSIRPARASFDSREILTRKTH